MTNSDINEIMKKHWWYAWNSNPGPNKSKYGKRRRMDWAMAATASLKIILFQDAYNNLKKILANKWEFVMMQADEQV